MLSSQVNLAGVVPDYPAGMDTPGSRLRQLRKMRDLTLEDVGAALGISPQAISQIETGATKGAKPENFLKLCAFYGVNAYRIAFDRSESEIASEVRARLHRKA